MKLRRIEMLRGFCAIYVFLGHFLLIHLLEKNSAFGFFFRFGQEAVILFFIISGFVIFYSINPAKNINFTQYFERRFLRIYPIFLFSIFICILFLIFQNKEISILNLLGNILMFQDFDGGKPGVFFGTFSGNPALWSLSYEWWFYMLFFIVWKKYDYFNQIKPVLFITFSGFITYQLIPNQISLFCSYFLIWWIGVELAKQYKNGDNIKNLKLSFSWLILLMFLNLINSILYKLNGGSLSFGIYPILQLRHTFAAVIFVTIYFVWNYYKWIGFNTIFKIFYFIAPLTYSIYILHYPLSVSSDYLNFIDNNYIKILLYILIVLLISYFAEYILQKRVVSFYKKIKSLIKRESSSSIESKRG